MASAKTRAILAAFNRAKGKRVNRKDKEKLKRQLKEQERIARGKLDKKVLADQKAEKRHDTLVKQYKQYGRRFLESKGWDRGSKKRDYGYGKNPHWKGEAPNTFTAKVEAMVERAERSRESLTTSLKRAQIQLSVIRMESASLQGKLAGLSNAGIESPRSIKAEIAKIKENVEKAKKFTPAEMDACVEKVKAAGGGTATIYIPATYRSGVSWGRPKYEERFYRDIAVRECTRGFQNRRSVNQEKEKLRMVQEKLKTVQEWSARFNALINQFKAHAKDDYLDAKERAAVKDAIARSSNLIARALQSGVSSNYYKIQELNTVRLAVLEKIKAQEKADLRKLDAEAAPPSNVQGPPPQIPIGQNLASVAAGAPSTVEVSFTGWETGLKDIIQVLEGRAAPAAPIVNVDTSDLAAALKDTAVSEEKLAAAFGQALWPGKDELVAMLKTIQDAQFELARTELSGRIRG